MLHLPLRFRFVSLNKKAKTLSAVFLCLLDWYCCSLLLKLDKMWLLRGLENLPFLQQILKQHRLPTEVSPEVCPIKCDILIITFYRTDLWRDLSRQPFLSIAVNSTVSRLLLLLCYKINSKKIIFFAICETSILWLIA